MGNVAVLSFLALQVNTPAQAPFTDTRTAAAVETQNRTKAELSPEMRGDIAMARKEYRQAIDFYKSIQPPSHLIYNKIGIAYHQLTDMETAVRFYQRAIKAKRDYPEAINNLGAVHYAQKSYRRAVTLYNRALKLRPSGYPADNIRQRIPACKQEMVKADSLAVMNPTALRETEKLREDNQKLQQENLALRAQLAGRPVSPPQGNSPAPATSTASPVRPPPNAASNGSRPQAAPACER